MTPQEHILQRLNDLKASPKEAVKFGSQQELVDYIYKCVMSKKFRKYSVVEGYDKHVRSAIESNVKNNEPIKIAVPFGSYKLWRFEESPEVDWAEAFAMIYYANWLKPVTDAYQPGVWFDFCGDDAILELMNNIPREDTEKYKQSIRSLIDFVTPFLPDNFRYTFNPVGERYASHEEFLADLNNKVEELRKIEQPPLSDRQKEMMRFNVKPKPGEEIDFEKNRLLHDAYMDVSKRRPYHKAADKFLVCCTPFGGGAIPLGTTKNSVVKFQTGVGVLKKSGEKFAEYIYSPSQLENSKFEWVPVSIPGLTGKNFQKIRIIK